MSEQFTRSLFDCSQVAEDGFGRVLSPRLELYMKAIDGTYAPPKINT